MSALQKLLRNDYANIIMPAVDSILRSLSLYEPSGKRPSLPSFHTLSCLFAVILALPVALHALFAFSPIATSSALTTAEIASARNALVVVAHPDGSSNR